MQSTCVGYLISPGEPTHKNNKHPADSSIIAQQLILSLTKSPVSPSSVHLCSPNMALQYSGSKWGSIAMQLMRGGGGQRGEQQGEPKGDGDESLAVRQCHAVLKSCPVCRGKGKG